MSPYTVADWLVWLVRLWFQVFLSMPTTSPTFTSLLADLFPAPFTSAPPSSGNLVAVSTVALGTSNSLSNEIAIAVTQVPQQSFPTFIAVFRMKISPPGFQCNPSPCFQHCSQLGHGGCQLAFICRRYVEIAAICVYIYYHFFQPQLFLGPPGFVGGSSNYGIPCSQLFFTWRKFGSVM